YELSRKLAVVTDTAAVLVKVTEAAQHLLRAPYGAVFLTNHTAGDLDLAYVHGLTDRDAVQLMRVCAGKVTADTTSPVTVEIQDAPWLRAVCTPIILAGGCRGSCAPAEMTSGIRPGTPWPCWATWGARPAWRWTGHPCWKTCSAWPPRSRRRACLHGISSTTFSQTRSGERRSWVRRLRSSIYCWLTLRR